MSERDSRGGRPSALPSTARMLAIVAAGGGATGSPGEVRSRSGRITAKIVSERLKMWRNPVLCVGLHVV